MQIYCRRKQQALVRFRLMQRHVLMKLSRVAGGGGALELGRRKEEEGTEGEKRKGPSGFIYRGKDKWQARDLRSLKRQSGRACRLDFRDDH